MWKMNAISPFTQKRGLSTTRVQSHEDLRRALNNGLGALYQRVFAEPPYNESFQEKEAEDIFHAYLQQGGKIFVTINDLGRPVAFVASVPLQADFSVAAAAGGFVNPEQTAYFAEDGVENNLRQMGLSAQLKQMLIAACKADRLETLILRTSIYNYKQISAVNKAGGSVISGLFQQVTSTRSDGTMGQDARSFYTFDLQSDNPQAVTTLNRVTIVRPGGNDTAIVWDDVARERQGALSKKIQATYPGIEQVMFVERGTNGMTRGQMAGGEFCGNATRSLGYLLKDGKDGEVTLEVSGASQPMRVRIKDGMAETSLPVKESLDSAQKDGNNYIVHLDGISFVITSSQDDMGQKILSAKGEDAQKQVVMAILEKNGFARAYPASGIMVAEAQSDGTFRMEPFVFVRDTGTLYYETGCGSGSTSVGVMVAKETGASVSNLKIRQPSGMDLFVSIDRDSNGFKGATVNGPIEIVFDGRMHIADPIPKKSQEAKLSR